MKFYIFIKNLVKSIRKSKSDKCEGLKNKENIQLILNEILNL